MGHAFIYGSEKKHQIKIKIGRANAAGILKRQRRRLIHDEDCSDRKSQLQAPRLADVSPGGDSQWVHRTTDGQSEVYSGPTVESEKVTGHFPGCYRGNPPPLAVTSKSYPCYFRTSACLIFQLASVDSPSDIARLGSQTLLHQLI